MRRNYMNTASQGSTLWSRSASDIARMIHSKEVSCTEVVQAHLKRIDEVNPAVNAVTAVLGEEAIAAAEEADAALAKGHAPGSLCGVPFTVKGNIDLVGSATPQGMIMLKDAVSPVDAPHIRFLKSAGAIPIARTNTSEMCFRPHTDNPLYGPTMNPWDPALTPGGSSGGDAVAVATGMAPLGMGNDYGGSLRVPSQFCGVATIKPTTGRVASHFHFMPGSPLLTLQLFFSQGPIARTVPDLRLALHAMCGYDPRDPHWCPAPLGVYPMDRKRPVVVCTSPGGVDADPFTGAAMERAAQCLTQAGYTVEEAEPPRIREGADLLVQLIAMETRTFLAPVTGNMQLSENLTRYVEYFCRQFPDDTLAAYMGGYSLRTDIAREWCAFFEKYPVLVAPGYLGPVPGPDFDIQNEEGLLSFFRGSMMIFMANLLGLPAVSVPMGFHEGQPVSVQVIANRFNEDFCLDVAENIEARTERHTPVTPLWTNAGQ